MATEIERARVAGGSITSQEEAYAQLVAQSGGDEHRARQKYDDALALMEGAPQPLPDFLDARNVGNEPQVITRAHQIFQTRTTEP